MQTITGHLGPANDAQETGCGRRATDAAAPSGTQQRTRPHSPHAGSPVRRLDRISTPSSYDWVLLAAVIAAASAPYFLAVLPLGLGVSPDSITYLSVAAAILRGEHGGVLVFPPGYPAAIAAVAAIDVPLRFAAVVVNYISLCVFIYFVWSTCRALSLAPAAAVMTTLFLATHASMQLLWQMACSESAFMAAFAAVLYAAVKPLDCRPTPLAIWLSLLLCIAYFFRYAGLALIPVGIVALMTLPGTTLPRRMRSVIVFVGLTSAFIALLAMRNYAVGGYAWGERPLSEDTVAFAVSEVLVGFQTWLVTFPKLRNLVPASLLAVIAAGLVVGSIVAGAFGPRDTRRGWLLLSVATLSTLGIAFFAQVFTLVDPISTRIMTPSLLPAAILGGLVATNLLRAAARSALPAAPIALALISAVVIGNYAYVLRSALTTNRYGSGYNTTSLWDDKEIEKILAWSDGGLLFSNDPARLAYAMNFPGRLRCERLPGAPPSRYRGVGSASDLQMFAQRMQERGGVVVVWKELGGEWAAAALAAAAATEILAADQYSLFVVDRGM